MKGTHFSGSPNLHIVMNQTLHTYSPVHVTVDTVAMPTDISLSRSDFKVLSVEVFILHTCVSRWQLYALYAKRKAYF